MGVWYADIIALYSFLHQPFMPTSCTRDAVDLFLATDAGRSGVSTVIVLQADGLVHGEHGEQGKSPDVDTGNDDGSVETRAPLAVAGIAKLREDVAAVEEQYVICDVPTTSLEVF